MTLSDKKQSNAEDFSDRFNRFLAESKEFCKGNGLKKDLLLDIYREESDASFILKIDALHESVCRGLLLKIIKFKVFDREIENKALDSFIESLSINGRLSSLSLLQGCGMPVDHVKYVRTIRKIRNSYAHDIYKVDKTLVEIISTRTDKSEIYKDISGIEVDGFDEAELFGVIQVEKKS